MAKYSKLSLNKLILTEVSRNLRKIFFRKIPPILKLEVGFSSDRKRFSQIFENWYIFFYLNFSSIKKEKKNRETFLTTKKSLRYRKIPRFWNFKLDFFPLFEITANLFYLKFISVKKKKNQRNFFDQKNPRFWHLKPDFEISSWIFFHFSKLQQIYFT